MRPWIKSFMDLENDPRVALLESKMKWSNDQAIARLHRLWWRCLEYCEDGILEKFAPRQIARMSGTDLREGERLVKALIECQFLDENPLRVHGWLDRVGTYLHGKYHTSKPDYLHQIAKAYGHEKFPAFGGRFQRIDTVNGMPEGIPKGTGEAYLSSQSLSDSCSQSRSQSPSGSESKSFKGKKIDRATGEENKNERVRELDSGTVRMELPDV